MAIRRWMTPDGTFRILAANSTEMVRAALEKCKPTAEVGDAYGRLLTGGALLQLATAPVDRMQFQLIHTGFAGDLLADVWPGPHVRGRIEYPRPNREPAISDAGILQVSRRPGHGGDLYTGSVAIDDTNIGAALQAYMMDSEQTLTLLTLVTVMDGETVGRAGGMIVQALPGAKHEHLEDVTLCLEQADYTGLVRAGECPIDAAAALFHRMGVHHLGDDPLEYRCRCSMASAVSAVLLLEEKELAGVRAGGTEKVTCDFCNTTYVVGAAELPEVE